MRLRLPVHASEAVAYFGGAQGAQIGYATCYTGGGAVDPLLINSPKVKTMRTARFEVYKAKDGWRWRLLAANNRQIAQGEAHTRERDAYRAIKAVRKAVAYTIKQSLGLSYNVDSKTREQIAASLIVTAKTNRLRLT